MAIVDTFPLGYGVDVLLLRLRTLAQSVDLHVITEADLTHSGMPREPLWPRLAADDWRFKPFVNKVIWRGVETPSTITDPHQREEWLRDETLESVRRISPALRCDDYILIGDADEVPNPDAVWHVRHYGIPSARLYGRYHEWHLDTRAAGGPYSWEHRQPLMAHWRRCVSSPGSFLRSHQGGWSTSHPERSGDAIVLGLRSSEHLAGWHFTLQGGADECARKLHSFAHTELAGLSRRRLSSLARARIDILRRAPLGAVDHSILPRPAVEDRDFEHMFYGFRGGAT